MPVETALTKDTVRAIQNGRIRELMRLCGWTSTQLAKAAGLAPSTINRFINGETSHALSAVTMNKLESAARGHVKDSRGDGIQIIETPEDVFEAAEAERQLRLHNSLFIQETVNYVPEVDIRVSAGDGTNYFVEAKSAPKGYFGFPKSGFGVLTGAPAGSAQIIEVVGDSMVPTLMPGQRVMVNTDDKTPSPPGIFVLWDGLGFVVKRVEYIPFSDPQRVKISSDNARYEPYERILEEAYIQGRVVGAWARI